MTILSFQCTHCKDKVTKNFSTSEDFVDVVWSCKDDHVELSITQNELKINPSMFEKGLRITVIDEHDKKEDPRLMLKMLIEDIENLPQPAKLTAITHYDHLALLYLLNLLFEEK